MGQKLANSVAYGIENSGALRAGERLYLYLISPSIAFLLTYITKISVFLNFLITYLKETKIFILRFSKF